MESDSSLTASCSETTACRRRTCRNCNNAYMRAYLRSRRHARPVSALFERAKARARAKGLPYDLRGSDLVLPRTCPVLGTELTFEGGRSGTSPSLDRIRPDDGYVLGNVRIVSDRANRLKGDRGYEEILDLSERGRLDLREDYAKVAAYLSRESLLQKVRKRAANPTRHADDWAKIADFLDSYLQRRGDEGGG